MPTFTSDVIVNINDPGVGFAGTEGAGFYSEVREISGALYQASNAKFNSTLGTWSSQNNAVPSYAVAQNADGSISYLYKPATSSSWSTSMWQGAGQPVALYAVNYGLTTTDGVGTVNTAALQAAVNAAITVGAATVALPAGAFKMSGSVTITGSGTLGLIIAGVSGQTELEQQLAGDMFSVASVEGQGVRFRDLRISYPSGLAIGPAFAAIAVSGSQNITCDRVYFHNCPAAFTTDINALWCGLLNCTIDYNNVYNGQTMVSLQGSQDFAIATEFRQLPINQEGPTGCIALALGSTNNGRYIDDVHISDFATGILLTEGLVDVYFTNVLVNAYLNAVVIKPTGPSGAIYGVHFANCTFALATYGNTGTSGVVVSTNGGVNSNVAGIYFTGCSAYGWGNAGIEVDGGQNIVITGGQYSSNGQSPSATRLGAGIAVAGGALVTISGADCSGINQFWQNNPNVGSPVTQPYALAVSNSAPATVNSCDFSGNHAGAIFTSSPGALQVYNCAGYNDQNTSVAAAPTSTEHAAGQGYFGPSLIIFSGGTSVTISGGTAFSMTFGCIPLLPYDTIKFTPAPTNFKWLGK